MKTILSIKSLGKTYKNGHTALKGVSFEVQKGEIFALLGPNGAGKTSLISAICGIIRQSSGRITVKKFDTIRDWRKTRKFIGLVPQELMLDIFESVWDSLNFSRGLFGKPPNDEYLLWLLDSLSLTEKRDEPIFRLSGGMKRRALIAKALAHQPELIFLDEPTAGVDVSLRKNMWKLVEKLRQGGSTIILTTHYIEEAEELSDRVAVINDGKIILVDDKDKLIKKLGEKTIKIELVEPIEKINGNLSKYNFTLDQTNKIISHTYNLNSNTTDITELLNDVKKDGYEIKDINTEQSSLEEIFIKLIKENNNELVRN